MKMPLDWHERCLKSLADCCERQAEVAEREKQKLFRLQVEWIKLNNQINRAKLKKISSFDPDRFSEGL